MQRHEIESRISSSKVQPTPKALLLASVGIVFSVLPAFLGMRAEALFWLFWIVLVLLFAYDIFVSARLSSLKLSLPKTMSIGEDEVLRLYTEDLSLFEVRLDTQPPLVSEDVLVRSIDGWAEVPLRSKRRGKGEVSAVWLRYASPMGLFRRVVCFSVQTPVDVLLNIPLVQRQALRFMNGRATNSGPQIERFYGDGSEFDTLREFLPGLDPRMIDWRSSARHTKLLFRQCRAERDRQVIIAVDTGRLMAEPLGQAPRLDHALHAAMLLSYIGARAGDRVGFFAFDEAPRTYLAPTAGAKSIQGILQKASELTYQSAETNFTVCLAELCSRVTRRSLIVVLTEFVDTVTAELMIENIQRVAKRHLVLFVALRDPLLQQEMKRAPHQPIDLHRSVIAASLQKEREVVLLRLRRMGVLCIDALPQEVGPALVNRYLEAKRREML